MGKGAPGHTGVRLPQLTQEGSLKEVVLSQAPAGHALVSQFEDSQSSQWSTR